jgi:uncharacterized protein YdaU (DUF1376 family)
VSAPPYMKLFWGDYHKATRHLRTAREHGAYLLLIGALWDSGGRLPADDATLARHALCTPKEWAAMRETLMAFFKVSRGQISQKRVTEELAKYESTSGKRKEAGRKGGRASHGKGEENSQANAGQKPTQSEAEQEQVDSSVPNGTGASPPVDPIAELMELPVKTRAWRLGRRVLVERGGMTTEAAGNLCAKWVKKDGLAPERLWEIAEAAWRNGTDDPAAYMGGAVREALTKRRPNESIDAPSERQQVAWMEDWKRSPTTWRRQDRGPRPGEEGCRVAPEVQRRFGALPFGEPSPEVGGEVVPFPPSNRSAA